MKTFLSTTLLAILLLITDVANAQFNKYRSRSRFKTEAANSLTPRPDETANADVADMSPEDAAKVMGDAAGPGPDSEEMDVESDDESDSEDEANIQTFGKRQKAVSVPADMKNKYVNLNPETAFGPEIVQSFDFPDTDIMEITRHMQKLTGINLILDKDVKGKVSIIAPTPITVGDAWKAYLTSLNMAGYTLVKSGAFYKVINARDIRYTPTKIYTGSYTPDTENYVMRVIALKNVSAGEIARNFRPFMTRYGRIIDIKQTNTVIIADTGSNINRMVKMIKFLDVPGHEESLQIVKVKNSSAQEIAKLLDSILKGGANGAARAGSAATPRFAGMGGESSSNSVISRIIAEPRTNSIIAMANAEGARQLKELINKLDVKLVSNSSNRVHVYYLNYGDSEELSKTLSSIVTGTVAKDAAGGAGANKFSSSGGMLDNAIFSAEVKITSDKNNNALVVTASPTDWLTLKDVISRLDIPRDQVYVEGMILEANVTKDRGFGVEWTGAYGPGNVQRAGLQSNGSAQSGLLNLLSSGIPTAMSGFFAGIGIGGTRTLKTPDGKEIKVNGVNALIKAVATHQNSNVLATPQILVLDNTEATFEVGETVPIVNQTVATGVSAFSTTNQEAKLSLKITPQINKVTRFVKLKINQKIDDFIKTDVTSAAAGRGLPTNTRSAITEVMVRDRDTIAMGGLLRDKESITFNKVPLLGDIPVLGWLFKSKSRSISKVNLLFFLTPKILAPYTKTASSNTKDVLARRQKGLEGIFEGDDKDPSDAKMKELNTKVTEQIKGPLYDEEDAAHYRNLNEDKIIPENENSENQVAPPVEQVQVSPDQLETPNYQDISQNAQKSVE
jgi:general secretion pathway protein D